MPGERTHKAQTNARYRSSAVINFLCVVFWITHGPFMIALVYVVTGLKSEDIFTLHGKYISCVFHSLFCLSAFFNPLALIIMSKQYRTLYKRYLCRKSPAKQVNHNTEEIQSLTLKTFSETQTD